MSSLRNLTKHDIEILKEWGYLDEELPQISRAITKTDYFHYFNGNSEKITHKQARELLGDEQFLSGISRSAFHYTAGREIEGKGSVSFDSARMFKEFEKQAEIEKEIIELFENQYKTDNAYGGMLPANSKQLEKYSTKKLNELCEYGILQKRNCEGLAYEFNSQYLNNVVIPKIKSEQLQELRIIIENFPNKYIECIEIEDITADSEEEKVTGWNISISTPLWENFSFTIEHNNEPAEALKNINDYVYNDYDFDKEEYIEGFIKCQDNCLEDDTSLNIIIKETEILRNTLQNLAQCCNEYNITKHNDNELEENNDEPEMDI